MRFCSYRLVLHKKIFAMESRISLNKHEEPKKVNGCVDRIVRVPQHIKVV